MKKIMLFGISSFLTVCFSMSATQIHAQKSDETAIKTVLNQETNYFFHKNYDAWATTWSHDTVASLLAIGPAGFGQITGWNAIASKYKTDIENLRPRTEAEIAPFLNKTDYHIYINGNIATVSFKEGDKSPKTEMRTMIKQNGSWKILNYTLVNSDKYDMNHIMDNMKIFVGKWVLDGTPTMVPNIGGTLNSAEFELWETPTGLEQTSKFMFTDNKGVTAARPTSYEYFIPDNNTSTIFYLSVDKNLAGQTFTGRGTISSEKMNSFTVTSTYPDKPDAIESEYTVTLENGKWHQVGKRFDRDGKQTSTSTLDLRRL